MENTLENKAKFFAQYWRQEVAIQNEGGGSGFRYDINEATITEIKYDYLLLTPLSVITDEDAIELGKYRYKDPKMLTHLEIGKALIKEFLGEPKTQIELFEADYLRSKGYALPYMGLSVEQLIEYGWIKLKD